MKTSREIRQLNHDLEIVRDEFKSQLGALIVEISKSELVEFHASFIYVVQTISEQSYIENPDLAARELIEIAQNAKTLQRQYLSRASLVFAAYAEQRATILVNYEAR